MVSAGHILAGSSVHAWVGLTFIVIDVAILAAPARVTGTFVSIKKVLASAMYAGVAATLVNLGQTGGIIVSLWAQAGEAIDAIHTCASIVTGVDGTVVNVDVTHCSCVTGLACTFIAIYFVDALPVVTGLALAVIQVHFTIETRSALWAGTDVCILPVLANAAVLTGLA